MIHHKDFLHARLSSQECIRCQQKHERLSKLEKTGGNAVKVEQARRSFQLAKDDYARANRLLLLELPQFYDKRVDYFQPSLQVLWRPQRSLAYWH